MEKVSRKKVQKSEQKGEEIGDRIALIRRANRLSLTEFAGMVSLSKGNLSEIEKNRYKPSYSAILKIIQHFSVNARWLMTGCGRPFLREIGEQARNIAEMVYVIDELDRGELGQVNDFLQDRFAAAVEKNDRRRVERRSSPDTEGIPGGKDRRSGPDRRSNTIIGVKKTGV